LAEVRVVMAGKDLEEAGDKYLPSSYSIVTSHTFLYFYCN